MVTCFATVIYVEFCVYIKIYIVMRTYIHILYIYGRNQFPFFLGSLIVFSYNRFSHCLSTSCVEDSKIRKNLRL